MERFFANGQPIVETSDGRNTTANVGIISTTFNGQPNVLILDDNEASQPQLPIEELIVKAERRVRARNRMHARRTRELRIDN